MVLSHLSSGERAIPMIWPCKSMILSGLLNLSFTESKSNQFSWFSTCPSRSCSNSLSRRANLSFIEGPGDNFLGNSTLSIFLKPIW